MVLLYSLYLQNFKKIKNHTYFINQMFKFQVFYNLKNKFIDQIENNILFILRAC